MSTDLDKQRAERIRRRQLAERDPGNSKIRGYDWAKHSSKQLPKQPPLVLELLYLLPLRWRGLFLGLIFGGIIALVMRLLMPLNEETAVLMIVPLLISGVVGFVIGQVMQPPPIK